MDKPFDIAWTILKQLQPFVPRELDEQIGMGTFRAAYQSPDVPHVTKFGSGQGVANALMQTRGAEMYPELFVSEELHALPKPPSELPEWLTSGKENQTERITGDILTGGEIENPFVFTQEKGRPITVTSPPSKDLDIALRNYLWEEYPTLQHLGLWDVKPENWAQMPGGIELPESITEGRIPGQVKIIDPQFNAYRKRGYYPDETIAENRRFQEGLPTLYEFAKPWYQGLSQYEDPGMVEDALTRLLISEDESLRGSLSALNP